MHSCITCGATISPCISKSLLLFTDYYIEMLITVQEWNGAFFDDTSLHSLGLKVHLGHGGNPCPMPFREDPNFTLVDVSGVHRVNIIFCGCPAHPHPRIQLLRHSWFPASIEHPETAFTFELLNFFHLLTLQGKISAYDFYTAVHGLRDNAGLAHLPVSHY